MQRTPPKVNFMKNELIRLFVVFSAVRSDVECFASHISNINNLMNKYTIFEDKFNVMRQMSYSCSCSKISLVIFNCGLCVHRMAQSVFSKCQF